MNKVINKFYETIEKFINWICHRFGLCEGEDLIRNFQKETNTFLNAEKQLKKEDKEKEWDLEL